MVKIRSGTFETNSSSMHSFSIAKNEKKYTIEDLVNKLIENKILFKDKNNNYFMNIDITEEFGWGIDHFTDVKTKLSYFALRNIKYSDISGINMIENTSYNTMLEENRPELQESYGELFGCDFEDFKSKVEYSFDSGEFSDYILYPLEKFLKTGIKIRLVDYNGFEIDENTDFGYVEMQYGYQALYENEFFGDEVDIEQAVINFLCDDTSVLVIDNDNH